MEKLLKKYLLLVWLICFFQQTAKCQNFTLAKIYMISNVYDAQLKNKNDLKLAVSTFGAGFNSANSYSLAYSAKNNFGLKFNTTENNRKKFRFNSTYFNLTEFTFGAGYYNTFTTKKAKEKFETKNKKFETKLKFRNEYRKTFDKKPITKKQKFKQAAFFIYSAYLSYGFGNLQGNQVILTSNFPIINNTYKTAKYSLDRYNLDIALTYHNKKSLSFSYIVRASLVNFKNIEYFNPNGNQISTFDAIKLFDPFIAVENNLKISFNTKPVNVFWKINSIYGKRRFEINLDHTNITYKDFTHSSSTAIGLKFNLENIFKFSTNAI